MSLKENVDFVKEELNSEEKFLEGFVKLERFFKKYKIFIISAIAFIVVAAITVSTTSYLKEENKLKANIAFQKVLNDPNDKVSLESLKDLNTRLYEIALYKNAKANGKEYEVKNTTYLKEIVAYEKAIKEQNIAKLNDVSMEKNFLLKEFAIFNKALLLAKDGKFEEARDTLKLIPQTSQVKDLVSLLNHYLLTK